MYFSIVLSVLVISQINGESCKTPTDQDGDCILLRECPELIQKTAAKNSADIELLQKSICGLSGFDSLVCCPRSQSKTSTGAPPTKDKKSLLASKKYCGYQHSDDFFHDDNVTDITEFPWLARLNYQVDYDEPSYHYQCVGSLINHRYILTSATCVSTEIYDLKIVGVRLGEYHVVNDTDCVSDQHLQECSEPVQDFGIEKIIQHPEFTPSLALNDIALVRLNGSVQYSDYVRPICLPVDGVDILKPGDPVTISGWGIRNFDFEEDVKKRIPGVMLLKDECFNNTQFSLYDSQSCIRFDENATYSSCNGDGGAPVLFSRRLQWFQEGIIMFGVGPCGSGYPEIHTRVYSFIDWILETIEP